MTPELITFGRYLAGEFENQRQAQAEPVWYVHLRLWLRPLPLFREDSREHLTFVTPKSGFYVKLF
jgi:hypothetical protein